MSATHRFAISRLAALIVGATCTAASAQDIYIGTLEADKSSLVLRRCDLAENRYELVDSPGARSGAVQRQRKRLDRNKSPVYAEVIGAYEEVEGRNRLVVRSFRTITAGKSCHLIDAVDDLGKANGNK